MARRKMIDRWLVGEYEFVKYDDNGETLYGFAISDHPEGYELYASLDHAMAAAIAEKHTGRRGAGGEAVGTAADWFIRMIGADDPRCPEQDCGEPLRLIRSGAVGHCGIKCGP